MSVVALAKAETANISMKDKIFFKKILVFKNSSNGFSMIEMLVVLFIVTLISSIVLVNFRSGEADINLREAAQKLALDLRRAQASAESVSTLPASSSVPYGYGIYLDQSTPTSYIFFADLNNDKSYSISDQIIETITLPANIQIMSLSPGSPLQVYFLSPSPVTYINLSTSSTATIILQVASTTLKTKTITVNSVGRIDVQ